VEIEDLIKELLIKLNVDIKDRNIIGTPRRVREVLEESTGFNVSFDKEYEDLSKAVFPHKGDNMIIARGIESWALCPHHLLPVVYTLDIAYLPHGYVIGVSKLDRFAKLCAKRMQLQEDYTMNLGYTLQKWLHTDDVAVLVVGRHSCMQMRGVKSRGEIVTSEVLGAFRDNDSVRSEFMKLRE